MQRDVAPAGLKPQPAFVVGNQPVRFHVCEQLGGVRRLHLEGASHGLKSGRLAVGLGFEDELERVLAAEAGRHPPRLPPPCNKADPRQEKCGGKKSNNQRKDGFIHDNKTARSPLPAIHFEAVNEETLKNLVLPNIDDLDKPCGSGCQTATGPRTGMKKKKPGRMARRRTTPAAAQPAPTISSEDYLERIDELITCKGYARVVDIAARLVVSQPSVTAMVKRLADAGYLHYERYRGLALTDLGRSVALGIKSRHATLQRCLSLLGVDEATQEQDIEGLEHCLSATTLQRLGDLADFFESRPEVLKEFQNGVVRRSQR
jgi:Mn-dependent DtxR family transcriptional regulator